MTDKKVVSLRNRADIEEAAALWVVRLDDGGASPEVLAAFQRWYRASDANKAAFDRLSSDWGALDALSGFADLAASDHVVQELAASRWRSFLFSQRRSLAAGLAASLLIAGGLAFFYFLNQRSGEHEAAYLTAVGEQKSLQLPDGSSVTLNTNSMMTVDYGADERLVRLQSGEAYFEVEQDTKRPFSVITESGRVTAIGTAFNVRVHEQRIDVVVTRGRVALAPSRLRGLADASVSRQIDEMEVTAGQTVVFSQQVERLDEIDRETIDRKLDWRDGVLAFNGEPLEQVIEDVGRYTELIIEIKGEELGQRPIGGYFRVGETEALLEALTVMAELNIERTGDNRVVISALPAR